MNIVNIINICTLWLFSQRDRWILWAPVILAAGIGCYFSLKSEPPFFAGMLGLAMLGAFYWPVSQRKPWLFLWIAAVLFAAGFTAAQVRTAMVTEPVLLKETYPLTVEGKVIEVDALPKGYRIVIDDIAITAKWPTKGEPTRVRIKLKGNDPAVPRAGDVVRVKAVLLPLSAPVLPGAFDFQRHAFFKRLGATGYSIGNLEVISSSQDGFFFEELRHGIRERIEAGIDNKDTAAIVTAFLIGESKGISEKTWDVIRLAGIAHLLAISGFHITVICGFLFFGIRALLALSPTLALKYPIKKISAFFAMWGAVFYMLLIGSPVPAERAVIMACVVMVAVMLDRDPFTLRLAAFAAMVVLLLQPEALVGPSFQLSFAAVVALIAFYESLRDWWSKSSEDRSFARRYSLYILSCFLTTVVASLATAPYSLFHFARVPLFSGLVTNMIAVPVSSFITLPFGVLACVLMPLGLEKWALVITEASIDIIMAVANETAHWQNATYHADAWPIWILCMMTLGGLWLCIWHGKARFLGILPILAGILLIPLNDRPDFLAASNGKFFAARDSDGILWISSSTSEKFIREEWTEQEGDKGVKYWKDATPEFISCTENLCTVRLYDTNIAVVQSASGFSEACAADFIFSAEKMEKDTCKDESPKVFDKYVLRDKGAHSLYLQDGTTTINTASEMRGQRPWTGQRYFRDRKKPSESKQ